MRSLILTITAYAGLTAAWMPTRKDTHAGDVNESHQGPIYQQKRQDESTRWPPSQLPIRGVNLGSQFVIEPWMANDEWYGMGCSDEQASEFDCVAKLGQDEADRVWDKHWSTWTTKDDIAKMKEFGLNAIRIPVGYWIREDLVYRDSEHFPNGGLRYLEQICGWASDAGFFIVIDLHGAPGAQVANNAYTGQVGAFRDAARLKDMPGVHKTKRFA